jgi:hypothetical protein
MNKKLLFLTIIFSLSVINSVFAYIPQEQQRAVDDFKGKYNFSKVTFSDNNLKENTYAYYQYKWKGKHTIVKEEIIIQPLSQELNIHKFRCLLEHEYGHRLEALNSKKLNKGLSESFADDYMLSVYQICERFYE